MDLIRQEAHEFKKWVETGDVPSIQVVGSLENRSATTKPLFPDAIDYKAAGDLLRECKVNLVCVAPGLREIRIGLGRKPSKRATNLPGSTSNGHLITYHEIQIPQIAFPSSGMVGLNGARTLYNGRYPCGSSISIANKIETGTLGCLARKDGILYGLTNNHVTGLYSHNKIGMPISAPGLVDVSEKNLDPFVIGHHKQGFAWTPGTSENVSIDDNIDLALFSIADEEVVTSFQGHHYDTPIKVATRAQLFRDDLPSIKVMKVGRTTGLTTGWLFGDAGEEFPVSINDPKFKNLIYFVNMFTIENDGNEPFAKPGDSGSFVVRDNDGTLEAIGIVFAISPKLKITHVMPMEVVLDRLGLTLVGDHNVNSAPIP